MRKCKRQLKPDHLRAHGNCFISNDRPADYHDQRRQRGEKNKEECVHHIGHCFRILPICLQLTESLKDIASRLVSQRILPRRGNLVLTPLGQMASHLIFTEMAIRGETAIAACKDAIERYNYNICQTIGTEVVSTVRVLDLWWQEANNMVNGHRQQFLYLA